MAAMVPMSLMVRRSEPGVSGAAVRPNSLAKARTSFTAAGSAPWFFLYWAWVRRCLPVRLATLSGVLRRTRTETVVLVPEGGGFFAAGKNGAGGGGDVRSGFLFRRHGVVL